MALNALFSAGTVLTTVAIVLCSLVALVVSLAAIGSRRRTCRPRSIST